MHATVTIGSHRVMGSDAPPGRYEPPAGTYVSVQLGSQPDGERVFKALADGGTVEMPFAKTFWSPGFGMVTDRFGIPWMINVEGEPA
jgi:PhnB protein